MLEEPLKKYEFRVRDIRNTTPDVSTVVFADTISKAVGLFLQDYLKNSRLVVEITEKNYTSKRI